jgi:hypothetical protein
VEPKLSPKQTLFIWRLLIEPEGTWQGELKPKLSPKEREPLCRIQHPLIVVDQRKKPNNRRAAFVKLTEAGWLWAEEHLDAELPKQGTAALPILRAVMTQLKARLAKQEFTLADFFAPSDSASVPDEPANAPRSPEHPIRLDTRELTRRVLAECQQLSDGALSGRVRLADLRSALGNVPREEVDRVLLNLEREESLAVYPLDNPQEIAPADRAAALPNSGGDARHVVYLSNK